MQAASVDAGATQQIIVGVAVGVILSGAGGFWRVGRTVTRVESILIGADGKNGIRGELRAHIAEYAADKKETEAIRLDYAKYRAVEEEWREGTNKRLDRVESRGRRLSDPYAPPGPPA